MSRHRWSSTVRWVAMFGAMLAMPLVAMPADWWPWRSGADASQWRTALVERGSIERVILATGRLRPAEFVDVGAQVSGQLERLHVREGDRVQRGELLAEIDPTLAEARLAELEASTEDLRARIRAKQADIALARTLAQRAEHLFGLDAGSREDMEVARSTLIVRQAELEALEANLRQIDASLRTARANLEYTRIHAPIDGVVTTVEARVGQTLNASQQAPVVLRIANLDRMRVEAQVSEADVLRLEPGIPARFSPLGRRDLVWESVLETVLPEPDELNDVVFYPAIFEVDNPEGVLRSRMTVQVHFVIARADETLRIPLSYLVDRTENRGRVWVLAEGQAIQREVRLGLNNDTSVAVLEGLAVDERVIDPRSLAAQTARGGRS